MTQTRPSRNRAHGDVAHLKLPDWGWDVIAVIVILSSVAFPGGPPPQALHPPSQALPFLPAIGCAAIIPLRRRWPISIFALCLASYSITVFTGMISVGAGIAAIIAAYGMANRTTRRSAFIVGGVGAAVVAVISIVFADSRVLEFGVVDPRIFQIAAGIAIGVALGDSTRSRRDYLSAMTERAERAEQSREAEAHRRVTEERLRIARDLHDTVAHQISVISLNAGVATASLEGHPAKAKEALGTIRIAARSVLSEIGELLRYLRTQEDSSQPVSPQLGLQQLDELVNRVTAAGLHVETKIDGDLTRVIGSVDLVAYRIVQEGLANAHKHGSGQTVTVIVSIAGAAVHIDIVNPVSDEHSGQFESLGGQLGLLGVQERVATVGGFVEAQHLGNHFRLTARLPLREEETV